MPKATTFGLPVFFANALKNAFTAGFGSCPSNDACARLYQFVTLPTAGHQYEPSRPEPDMTGTSMPAARICFSADGPPGAYEQRKMPSGLAERRRVICVAIDGSLFWKVSSPAIAAPSSVARRLKYPQSVRSYSTVVSSRM